MSGTGKTLQEARRRRGLTLDDAERETRICKRYLLALEQEDFEALPPPVYALGFLRLYARYLDLDPRPMVAEFTEQTGITAGPQPLARTAMTQLPPVDASPRLSTFVTLVLVVVSAATTFLFFQAVKSPAAAAWSSIRRAVAPEAGEIRFPFLLDLTGSWTAPGPSEGADRQLPRNESGPAVAAAASIGDAAGGDAAGGGDRVPTTANVPSVLLIPPWFLPPATDGAGTAQRPGQGMPSVIGRSTDEARAALENLGLAVAIEHWWSPQVPAGFVIHQHPAPQQPLVRTQPAVIVISRGPIRITVPDLVGRTRDEAQQLLQQAGLVGAPLIRHQGPKDLPFASLNTVCNGCVLSASPPPGSELPPEGIVTLAVRMD